MKNGSFAPIDKILASRALQEQCVEKAVLTRIKKRLRAARQRRGCGSASAEVLKAPIHARTARGPFDTPQMRELLRRQQRKPNVRKAFDLLDCDDGVRFAIKHGLEAYRDARILIAKAHD